MVAHIIARYQQKIYHVYMLVLFHLCFLFSLPILISITISQIYNQVRDGCFKRGSALCKERLCLHTVTLLDVWKQEICCATSPCPSHTSHTDTHTTNVIYTLYIIHSLLLVEAPLFFQRQYVVSSRGGSHFSFSFSQT